jgi:hypothetical protein
MKMTKQQKIVTIQAQRDFRTILALQCFNKGAATPFRSQSAHSGAKSPFIPPISAFPRKRLNSYENSLTRRMFSYSILCFCGNYKHYSVKSVCAVVVILN